jgi:glyceraldehyde 3-phosphate dehydrogenase
MVFINGFGRIGRSVLRAWAREPARWPGLEVVGINDIATPEMCAYLFNMTVFGLKGSVARDNGAGDRWAAPCRPSSLDLRASIW